jgi:hypothetical protein
MPEKIPGTAAPLLVGIMAAFGMFFFIIAIAFYVFFSLCLFLIAKKLNVPAPWTAWIPIVNIWTLVACAGKPAWWLILCFIPVVNPFVFIYTIYLHNRKPWQEQMARPPDASAFGQHGLLWLACFFKA